VQARRRGLGQDDDHELVRLENSFEVAAPVDAAWRLLNDVPEVVPHAGAELVEATGRERLKAKLHVKLGADAQFLADVTRARGQTAGRVVLRRRLASEGSRSAEATIESTLGAVTAGTRVDIATELELRGAVAQYGRGVVADVASRLTTQFAECIAAKLADAPVAEQKPIGGIRLVLGAVLRRLFHR
jgi:carbon monoxide dehydrogenase subunit G